MLKRYVGYIGLNKMYYYTHLTCFFSFCNVATRKIENHIYHLHYVSIGQCYFRPHSFIYSTDLYWVLAVHQARCAGLDGEQNQTPSLVSWSFTVIK